MSNNLMQTIKDYKLGDKIWFLEEKQGYTIQAIGLRYAVCTKPFNIKHTVWYTIIDFKTQMRGTDNFHGLGYETVRDCERALKMLEKGEAELGRNRIPLQVRA